MTVRSGTRLGPYEVLSPLGTGGMGEVYKGRDTRLDRTVAIKVLPKQLASDPQFRERFEREARSVGSLNHPHVCTLHDVGRHDGIDFLVMEYLAGETLQDRLRRGPIPVADALQIGIQIADALAAAHRAGVVHRDLKPGNIMLTKPGAKLLDFGLAKADAPAIAGTLSMLPTTPPGLTVQGTILGTFQYMAPEQLEGNDADARTDIFAFGSVLYEMLTGRKAFEGQSQASLIGAILKDTPPPASSIQPLAPASLDRLVACCLAKHPDDRWQSAHDVMLQLKAIAEGVPDVRVVATSTGARPHRREKLAWAAAVIASLGAAGVASRYFVETTAPELGAIQFSIEASISSGSGNAMFAVSPDGRRMVFEGPYTLNTTRSLWIRALESSTAQPLPGTEVSQVSNPFWSPDSRLIGFFADGKLKTISVAGGPPRILCDAPNSGGGSWSRDGTILFGSASGPVYRVPESGGTPTAVTRLDETRMETGHIRPQFMPDERRFIFFATSRDSRNNATYVGTLDSPELKPVEGIASPAAHVSPGYLIFARGGVLMARLFDANRLEGRDEPVPLGEIRQSPAGNAPFSVSQAGVLAYQGASASPETQLVWLTRDGQAVGDFPPRPGIHTLSLAPDQERAIVEERGEAWVLDGRRGTASRFTIDSEGGVHPFWSPDGRRIAFTSNNAVSQGRSTVWVQDAAGVSEAQPILQSATIKQLTDWSTDGSTLVFEERSGETGWNIGVVSLDGARPPRVVIQSRFQERMASLSPDGRYLAYTSDESGRTEVYVVTYPDVTDRWTISTAGGTAPRWRKDGNELFFIDPAGMLMSVPVLRGARFDVGVPKPLFDLQAIPSDGWNYAVSADGQRILAARATDAGATPITVVVNWPSVLNKPSGP
jgi:serine/threonine protein kinase